MDDVKAALGGTWPQELVCNIVAGDIVYDMAHDVSPDRNEVREDLCRDPTSILS